MPDRLGCLVKTIVGSLPVKDPHVQQRQQGGIVNLRLINNPEPLSPSDHMGPQPIIKVQVWEDVVPPAIVSGCLILPGLADPMEGSLGDLETSRQCFYKQKRRERLPQVSLDNVPIPTTGYTLCC